MILRKENDLSGKFRKTFSGPSFPCQGLPDLEVKNEITENDEVAFLTGDLT